MVLQTVDGMFLKFQLEEIPELKKNSRVCGALLKKEDTLEHVYSAGYGPEPLSIKERSCSWPVESGQRGMEKERKSGYNRIGSYDPLIRT